MVAAAHVDRRQFTTHSSLLERDTKKVGGTSGSDVTNAIVLYVESREFSSFKILFIRSCARAMNQRHSVEMRFDSETHNCSATFEKSDDISETNESHEMP